MYFTFIHSMKDVKRYNTEQYLKITHDYLTKLTISWNYVATCP